jgi:hypothetical protein
MEEGIPFKGIIKIGGANTGRSPGGLFSPNPLCTGGIDLMGTRPVRPMSLINYRDELNTASSFTNNPLLLDTLTLGQISIKSGKKSESQC